MTRAGRPLLRRPTAVFGIVTGALVVAAAVLSFFWTPYDPAAVDVAGAWQDPSLAHLFGTDDVGRDIASRVLVGARVTVLVAVGASVVAAAVGVALAALGSLTARWIRESVAVLVDVLIAFPTVLIAMMLAATLGGSLAVVVIAVGFGFGVNVARVLRPEIRRILRSDYILAGRSAGLGTLANLRRHLLPNVAPALVVQLSWAAGVAVLAEAGLSYLGYGAPLNTVSWGRMLAELQTYIGVHPLAVIWPGLAISITVLALNLLGDAIRDVSDPRLTTGRGPDGRGPDGRTPDGPDRLIREPVQM